MANPGDVVVAIITDDFGNESATLKTYFPKENEVELRPKNPTLKPKIIKNKDFQIRGVFRGLLRQAV